MRRPLLARAAVGSLVVGAEALLPSPEESATVRRYMTAGKLSDPFDEPGYWFSAANKRFHVQTIP
jgi:hypothetical protein